MLTLLDPEVRAHALKHLRKADPILGPVLTGKPLRFRRPKESLYAHLCKVITAQQVSVAAADAIHGRFAAACGTVTPENVLAQGVDVLRSCGLSRFKAECVTDLADGIAQGRHRLGGLGRLSDQEVMRRLTAIKGIGPWSADMVLIFRLHRSDILPTLDIGVRRGMERLYGIDPKLKHRDFHQAAEEIAKPWQPYRTLAVRYLWAWGDGDVTY